MSHAGRDPVFWAAMGVGERHSPGDVRQRGTDGIAQGLCPAAMPPDEGDDDLIGG